MNSNSYITLKDGRHLGFSEYGCINGFPILFFHGLPGSRLEAEKLHSAAQKLRVRLIGLDRPGMGLSSPQKNRVILDWPEDINEFTTALNLKTFSLIGHSGGAPYVAACAHSIPEKLHRAVIISGIAPLTNSQAVSSLTKSQKHMYWMIRYCPIVLKLMMKMSYKALENPNRLKSMLKQFSEVDSKIFDNEHSKESVILSLKEALRQDVSSVVDDFKLVTKAWGFDLEQLKCPLIVWQGGEDRQAPVKHAELYVQHVPYAKFMFKKEEGHISILYNYGKQILASALE